MIIEMLSERVERWGGWSRRCRYNGAEYRVCVERGRTVRIAFKPRGMNRGYKWNGAVYDAKGHCIWSGQVPGSLGVRGLLIEAGVYQEGATTNE